MENYRRSGEYMLREHVHELLTPIMSTLIAQREGDSRPLRKRFPRPLHQQRLRETPP